MGKIIGKSALCFAGLAVSAYLTSIFCDYILQIHAKPYVFSITWLFVLEFTLWLLLPLVYSYLLFLVFCDNRDCCIIMILNGVFVIAQYYLLLLLRVGGDVIMASLQASKVAGVPVILLALLFNKLKTRHNTIKAQPQRSVIINAFSVLTKSVFCFLAMMIITYAFSLLCSLPLTIFGYIGFFIQDHYCAFPAIFIIYAYLLFRLNERHRHYRWIIGINAVILMTLCAVELFTPGVTFPMPEFINGHFLPSAISIIGNAAILLPVSAYLFRGVKKHGAALRASQNAPEDIAPAHPHISG